MQIIGHRGARGEAPENTLGGFQYLKELGIRAVEFDVRQLKDHTLAVIHDDNFLRTTGIAQSVYDCIEADLVHYDHRKNWQEWSQVEYTPSLYQVLQLLYDFEHIEVEVKSVEDDEAAERITETLHQQLHGLEQQVTITSFDEKILSALQRQHSPYRRGFLIETDIQGHAVEKALDLGCERIGWMDRLATPEMIQLSHLAGLKVSVWTVNDVERAKALLDEGIDGLITDVPKTMFDYFK